MEEQGRDWKMEEQKIEDKEKKKEDKEMWLLSCQN